MARLPRTPKPPVVPQGEVAIGYLKLCAQTEQSVVTKVVPLFIFFSSGVSKLFGAQGSPSSGSLLTFL